ncbi:hypothetical protein FACS1894145_6030 [Bacteroidia bacterium]|nr:hypothetical protein FACS1894145_6030 [Bacteroidia bacterium]
MKKKFPHYIQLDAMDCGPTCLRMITKHYGRNYTLQTLRERSFITREGVSMLGISDAAESIGFHTVGVRIDFEQLVNNVHLPCILHWNQNHFVVLYRCTVRGTRYTKNRRAPFTVHREPQFYIADPAGEKYTMNKEQFLKCWISSKTRGKDTGTALLLEPTPEFIESLPLKYNTKIGMEGNGISQGQRQRLLIARAVYKNPEYLFLDEATNALDANNERVIMDNLNAFYQDKTVVIVAHRLSTVQHADNIIVTDDTHSAKSPSGDLGVELRSEEFQEVLGSVPHWKDLSCR